jgi:AcrR family transcriptional regulator
MEAVAAKSGVSKVTVYRRWPSKGALALEVLLVVLLSHIPQEGDYRSLGASEPAKRPSGTT